AGNRKCGNRGDRGPLSLPEEAREENDCRERKTQSQPLRREGGYFASIMPLPDDERGEQQRVVGVRHLGVEDTIPQAGRVIEHACTQVPDAEGVLMSMRI